MNAPLSPTPSVLRIGCVASAILLGTAAFTQPQCATIEDKLDEFTHERVLRVSATDHSEGPSFEWVANDGRVCLRLSWEPDMDGPAIVFEGDTLLVKFENGEVHALVSLETTVVKRRGQSKEPGTYCYLVEPYQLEAFNEQWVEKMRIHFRDGHDEYEASNDPNWQMGLWKSSNCLRPQMGSQRLPILTTGGGAPKVGIGH